MYRVIGLAFCCALAIFGADANDELLSAARKGDLAAVKTSCEQGATVEAKTQYGQTPLYLAAMNGHNDVVQFLIDKGARTDIKDTFYKASVLDFVLQRKHYEVAKTIISKGSGNADDELAAVARAENDELVSAVLAKGKVSQAVLDKYYEMALDRKKTTIAESLKQAGAHEPAPAVALEPAVLESYSGTYKSDQIPLDIKVFVKDGKLLMQATGQSAFTPKAKSPTVFEFSQAGLQVEFGPAGTFILKQGGKDFKFTKVATQ